MYFMVVDFLLEISQGGVVMGASVYNTDQEGHDVVTVSLEYLCAI